MKQQYCQWEVNFGGQCEKEFGEPCNEVATVSIKYSQQKEARYLCRKHATYRCFKCGLPATYLCGYIESFSRQVCDEKICAECFCDKHFNKGA